MPTTITDTAAPFPGLARPAALAPPDRLADRQIPCASLTSVGREGFDTSIRGHRWLPSRTHQACRRFCQSSIAGAGGHADRPDDRDPVGWWAIGRPCLVEAHHLELDAQVDV